MHRFTGHWYFKLIFAIGAGISVGFLYLTLFRPDLLGALTPAGLVIMRILVPLFFCGLGAASLFGLAEAGAIYIVDADGIMKRQWTGTRTLLWRDLDGYRSSGLRDSSLTLIDSLNRRLNVSFDMLGRSAELHAQLERHLAPLRERWLRAVEIEGRVFYPGRHAGIVILAVIAIPVLLGVSITLPLSSPAPESGVGLALASLFLWSITLALGLWFVHQLTRVLTVTTAEIVDRSLLRTTRIAFDQVEELRFRTQVQNGSRIEFMSIRDGKHKLAFLSHMDDYSLLADYLRSRVGKDAQKRGKASVRASKRKEERLASILLPVLVLLWTGMCLYGIGRGLIGLSNYRRIEKQGHVIAGEIIGLDITGGKNSAYLIRYQYRVDGVRIAGDSAMERADFDRAHTGDRIAVLYLPERPSVSHAVRSIGDKRAAASIRLGVFSLSLIAVYSILMRSALRRQRKRNANL